MRQLSIWSSATESRTSLRSSSFCFRDWTTWSLVRQIRPDKTRKCIPAKDYGVLQSGAILMLSAVDWMSTEKRWIPLGTAPNQKCGDAQVVWSTNRPEHEIT